MLMQYLAYMGERAVNEGRTAEQKVLEVSNCSYTYIRINNFLIRIQNDLD